MSTSSAQLLVFISGQMACIKITGRANFTSSLDFKTLVNELSAKGFTCYVLDLSECVLMDSTFLGVLAGMGLRLSSRQDRKTDEKPIEILNPNERILELLENLGVLHLFEVVKGPPILPEDAATHPCGPAAKPSREEVTRNCLEAHKTLMEISPANIPKFKEVTQFLAEDLKKLKPGP